VLPIVRRKKPGNPRDQFVFSSLSYFWLIISRGHYCQDTKSKKKKKGVKKGKKTEVMMEERSCQVGLIPCLPPLEVR